MIIPVVLSAVVNLGSQEPGLSADFRQALACYAVYESIIGVERNAEGREDLIEGMELPVLVSEIEFWEERAMALSDPEQDGRRLMQGLAMAYSLSVAQSYLENDAELVDETSLENLAECQRHQATILSDEASASEAN